MRNAFRLNCIVIAAALLGVLHSVSAFAQLADPADDAIESNDSLSAFSSGGTWLAHSMQIDERTLAAQRGRAAGMVMVSATPEMLGAARNSVTLWDEITPPKPMPIPVDAQSAMQSNSVSYVKK